MSAPLHEDFLGVTECGLMRSGTILSLSVGGGEQQSLDECSSLPVVRWGKCKSIPEGSSEAPPVGLSPSHPQQLPFHEHLFWHIP